MAGAFSSSEAFTKNSQNFTILSATLAGILVKDNLVEGMTQDFCLAANVFVTAITGTTDNHRPLFGRHSLYGIDQGLNGVGIVSIVGNESGAMVIEDIEPPRCHLGIVHEGGKAGGDGILGNTQCPAGRRCSHGILNLETDVATACDGNGCQGNTMLCFAFGLDNEVSLGIDYPFPLRAMGGNQRVEAVAGKVDDLARTVGRH